MLADHISAALFVYDLRRMGINVTVRRLTDHYLITAPDCEETRALLTRHELWEYTKIEDGVVIIKAKMEM